jgi:hypothetical protein
MHVLIGPLRSHIARDSLVCVVAAGAHAHRNTSSLHTGCLFVSCVVGCSMATNDTARRLVGVNTQPSNGIRLFPIGKRSGVGLRKLLRQRRHVGDCNQCRCSGSKVDQLSATVESSGDSSSSLGMERCHLPTLRLRGCFHLAYGKLQQKRSVDCRRV